MDSAFIIEHKRSPGLLSASSAHHLLSTQTFWLPKAVRTRAVDSGSSGLRPAKPTLAILGSGDFSKSLTFRLLRCGFCVVVGSRHPKLAAQSFPHVVDVTHYEDAVLKANIVFLAIRREHYSVLWDLKHLMEGKVHTLLLTQSIPRRFALFGQSVVFFSRKTRFQYPPPPLPLTKALN